jgi:hypothetical protein
MVGNNTACKGEIIAGGRAALAEIISEGCTNVSGELERFRNNDRKLGVERLMDGRLLLG